MSTIITGKIKLEKKRSGKNIAYIKADKYTLKQKNQASREQTGTAFRQTSFLDSIPK